MYELNPDLFNGVNQGVWEASAPKSDFNHQVPYDNQFMPAGMDQYAFVGNGDNWMSTFPCQLVAQNHSDGTDQSAGYTDTNASVTQQGKRQSTRPAYNKDKIKAKKTRTLKRDARQSSTPSLTGSSSSSQSLSPGTAVHSDATTPQAPGDDLRSISLERNRIAAAKCRIRKKEWVDTLQVAAKEGNLQSRELQGLVTALEQEVAVLKDMLQNCSCHYGT